MLLRYSGSLGGGALITAVLIYAMQTMVGTDDLGIRPGPTFDFSFPVPRIDKPPPRVVRQPPQPPVPRDAMPATPRIGDQTRDPTPSPIAAGPVPVVARGFGAIGLGDRVGFGDADVLALVRVDPIYPQSALVQGLEGRVLVEFTVTERGTVRDARVIESSHRVFERAALAAVARFRYQPRVIDGTPMAVPGIRTEFAFRLEN